jgi:hypothetical protein
MNVLLHLSRSDGFYEWLHREKGVSLDDLQAIPDRLTLGPFPEWVQMTYAMLRVGPEGEFLLYHDVEEDDWKFDSLGYTRLGITPPDAYGWTDVVIEAVE